MGGGRTRDGVYYKDLREYNAVTSTWVQKANFPNPAGRMQGVVFVIGTKAYIGLGTGVGNWQAMLDDLWEYNTVTNVWTQKASFPGGKRLESSAFVINGKGYVWGGNGVTETGIRNPKRDLWEYDPITNTWTQRATLPNPVSRASALGFSVNGKGYIGGGHPVPASGHYLSDLWQYDPNTDQWTEKANLPTPDPNGFTNGLGNCHTVTVCDKVYIFGGFTDTSGWELYRTRHSAAWTYDPISDTFTNIANFVPPWYDPYTMGAAYFNGAVYGGFPYIMEYKKYTVSGPEFVCTSATYDISGIPFLTRIRWETSPNLSISSSYYPSVTVSKVTKGAGWVRAVWTTNGCETSVTKYVQVGPETANFSISSIPDCGSPGEYFDFIAEIQNVNYSWTVNGGTLLSGQGTRFLWAQMNSSTMAVHCYVTGTSTANCYGPEGISSTYINQCWGFSSVSTSPNPASTSFDVELSEEIGETEPVEIELRNDYGALVKSATVQGGNFKINVPNLKNGPYILKVKYKDQILTHRIMIEN